MASPTATIDGAPVRWLEQGTGRPVVQVWGVADPFQKLEYIAEEVRGLAAEVAAR
jgi:hypothetical protein